MWAAVRQLTGRKQNVVHVDGVNANTLNSHYASYSTDSMYMTQPLKLTASSVSSSDVSEERVFRMLDKLKSTSTGLDHLPAWFLRLGAPLFAKPLANLISLSFETSTVPIQWKQARICPVPKTASPAQLSDYRPISITSVLSRVTERIIVKDYLYPSLGSPPPTLTFTDQYAFRPSPAQQLLRWWLFSRK